LKQKTRKNTHPTVSPSDLQREVEARLESLEPDTEVLLVELTGTRGSPAIRVYLDRPDGVDHELCARATRELREFLRDYAVEVSSPGPSRPLTKPEHYPRFLGRRARVRTNEAIEGKSEFKGELIGADEDGVDLAGEWGTVRITYERIKRSNLLPQPAPLTGRRT
jgi:ribosome maturation factor RimP